MFDKVQESLKKSKDERQKKRLEKERVRLEKAAAEAVREKERLQQAEKIQAEKDRLLSLDDKGLMVELILAVRGLYSQMEYIQSQQASLSERVDDIESDISSIRSDISDLESRLGSSDQ
jgi:cell division protein FtsL